MLTAILNEDGIGAEAIAQQVDRGRSTVFNHLEVLRKANFIIKHEHGKYSITSAGQQQLR